MSRFSDNLKVGLQTLEDQMADANGIAPLMFWNGLAFPCVPNVLARGTDLVEGPFAADVALVLFVRKDSKLSPITVDSDQITVDSDTLTVDRTGSNIEFGDTLTVDSTAVTVDSDTLTVDTVKVLPRAGSIVTYLNVDYRVLQRQELQSFYRFTLEDPNR